MTTSCLLGKFRELLKKAVHADRVYYLDRIEQHGIESSRTWSCWVGPDWVEIRPKAASGARSMTSTT